MAYDQDSQLTLSYSSLVDLIEKTSLRYGDKPAMLAWVKPAVLTR